MNNMIYPCMWMNYNAEEAATLYTSAFQQATVVSGNSFVFIVSFGSQKLMLLNGGEKFRPNAFLSLFVKLPSAEAVTHAFDMLAPGGKTMMDLNSYPWSSYYGWVEDRYGVSWQLMHDPQATTSISMEPCLMYTGSNAGKAADAMKLYVRIFPSASVNGVAHYEEGEGDNPAYIKHAEFTLLGTPMMAMDSSIGPGFPFTEGTSLVVPCHAQQEIDAYWDALIADGGEASMCGWLIDKYGLNWQIVPANMELLMSNPATTQRVMAALMPMRKIIMAELEEAAGL